MDRAHAFLELFVREYRINWDRLSCSGASIETEVVISGRRIDILIRSNDLAFAIENKPWARDQSEQVASYLSYLDGRFGTTRLSIYRQRGWARQREASLNKTLNVGGLPGSF